MIPSSRTLVPGLVLLLVACNEPSGPKFQTPQGPDIDVDTLHTRLRNALDTTTVGYAFVISRDGQAVRSRQSGWARIPIDGSIAQSVDKPMVMFSLSKLLTAVAAIRLIEQRGLTVDSTIGPWLPPSWNAPQSVRSLTFRELLSHRSGLRSTQNDASTTQSWNGMRDSIANGTPLPKTYNYLNLNFALFQVMIPALWRGETGGPPENLVIDQSTASFWYRWYVISQLLEPAGITGADCTFPTGQREQATRFYSLEVQGAADPDDRTLWCASGGWYLSASQMARFMAYLRHTNTLLTAQQRQRMDTMMLGWDGPNPVNGTHGSYYTKNGSRTVGVYGGQSQVMVFPTTGVEVTVFVNSRSTSEWNLRTLIRNAYEAAIID